MSRLYTHLAEICETADGGFTMTRPGRRYFSHFLRQHGKALHGLKTYTALIEALGQCNAADFAAARRQMRIAPPDEESRQRLVA